MPVRRVPHWKSVMREIISAGFDARLVRLSGPSQAEPVGDLSVAATAR
jgi:hypothetical protein